MNETPDQRRGPRWITWVSAPITDQASALRVARQGAVAATIVAVLTGLVGILGALKVSAVTNLGFDASALVDAALFVGIAVGVWRGSFVFAVSGLVLFISEKIFMWVAHGAEPGGLAIVLLCAFANGVRGTHALRSYRRVDPVSANQAIEPR